MGDCQGLMFPKPTKKAKNKKSSFGKKDKVSDRSYCPACCRSVEPDEEGKCPNCGGNLEGVEEDE